MKFYSVICRDSNTGANLRVVPQEGSYPQGFEKLDGQIQAANIQDATHTLKLILIKGLKDAGFVWKETPGSK
jgi:hypothetical protein